MEAAVTSNTASPLMVSIGDTAKSSDTGQMRSSSPFTPNSFPCHKTSLMTSSPPAATTAGSPLQNETHLSPSKESAITDQPLISASVLESGNSVASSSSDVETFNGKIVYNPDGSAYIIEDPDSDRSDVEAEISQEGSIIDARGLSPHYGSICFPQVVSAFHISRSSNNDLYSALCGQALAQNSSNDVSKVPEVPVMHSYRVFSLRNKEETATGACHATDEENGLDFEDDDAKLRVTTVPVKPILMCFICKLSFGYIKSFVAHAVSEHHLTLNEEEKRVLSSKNISAIIQGVGKEKEPLLSFLKPKSSPAPFCTPSQGQQQIDAQHLLAVQMAAVASALRSNSLPSPSSTNESVSLSNVQSPSPKLLKSTNIVVEPDIIFSESQSNNLDLFSETSDPKQGSVENKSPDRCSSVDSTAKQSSQTESQLVSELDLANFEKFAKAAAVQQQIDMQSLAAAFANAVVASNQTSSHQRTPSPGSKSSPKNQSCSQSNMIANQVPNVSSPNTFGALNSAAMNLMSTDAKNIFTNSSDTDTSNLLATSIANHVPRPNLVGSHPPLLMQHSRNSCKTLKCPKCNWHYKYQETLEIHMKEKHPENEMNCIYCLTSQPHPRLARGETYTCGYKPYRCDVCNYSTTTKGNLSIHMQSDKHINNVQELQNGNIPATAEHLLQSQALAAAVASAAAAAANGSGSSQTNSTSTSITSATITSSTTASPTSTSSGNSIVSDTKTPLHKMPPQASTPTTVTTPSPSPSQSNSSGKQKATWRCDVCNYETNVARNLRIHMTSEKHTHNIMVLRQNVSQMQQISALQQAGILSSEQLLQFNPGLLAAAAAAINNPGQTNVSENGSAIQPEAALADIAYNHALLMMQQQQRAATMAVIMQQQQQQQLNCPESRSPLMLSNGSQPTFDMEHPDPSMSNMTHLVPCDDSSRTFHCCVCATFTTDSIDTLNQHIQCDRTRTREEEVLTSVGGSYICKLCSYKTNLKANFQLHCKTEKHQQRLQHVNHIKEGGAQAEWKLKLVNNSNPVQVRCNLCDYYTNSIHKLQLHTTNPRHDIRSRIFVHLQSSDALSNNNRYYFCSLCSTATRTKFALIQHLGSMKHVRNESLHQLKQQQSSICIRDSDEEIREMFQVKEFTVGEKISFENGKLQFSFVACLLCALVLRYNIVLNKFIALNLIN